MMNTSQTNVITSMWAQLQRENKLPQGGVFSSCEVELTELMRQIDLMVHSKRMEWEKERQKLKARVDVKDQECVIHKATLDAKHQEVGQLRSQIEGMEKSRRDMSTEYERQLNMLRSEVSTMKKDYERLQRKYNKHAKQVQLDKNKEVDDQSSELQRMTQKMEEYRSKSREFDQERQQLEKEVDCLRSDNKALEEKCELIRSQSQTYQSQLGKRKEMMDNTEQNLRAQISQLENQLQRTRDTVNSQDSQLGRLKSSLDDAISAQRNALEEKEQAQEELQKAQQQFRRVEEENSELRHSLTEKEEVLTHSQDNLNRLNKDIARLSESLSEKEHTIHHLNDSSRQELQDRTGQLMGEIEQLRNSLKKHKRNEKQLLEESGMLQDKLDINRKEIIQLNQKLQQKTNEGKDQESQEIKQLKKETSKLREDLIQAKRAHEAEMEGMRMEVGELTTELHQRNLAVASLSEKAGSMERQLRDEDEKLERKNAELHVATAQLEAIRLENRHLRRSAVSGSRSNLADSADLVETEKHLKEIQSAYGETVKSLETQNDQLQEEVHTLRQELAVVENSTKMTFESALRESERSLLRAKHEQERLVREAKLAGDRRVRDLEDKLNDTVNDYERKMHELKTEMSLLEDELEIQNRSMRRLGLENEVMGHFMNGMDGDFKHKQLPKENGFFHGSGSYRHSSARETPVSFLEEDFMMDSADLATQQFLAEQDERTKELERKLDMHIEDLERSTDATIQKYLSPR